MKNRDRTDKVDWENLKFFLSVAETGSLSRAARMLHTDHSTVRRRIEILEQQVGAQLFYRHARGYDLTSTGERIIEWVKRMDLGAQGMASVLTGVPLGPISFVRVRSSPMITELLVRPIAHAAPTSLSQICIEFTTDHEDSGAPKRASEIALRCARPQGMHIETRLLGKIEFGLYASRLYLREHPEITRIADLSGHAFIDWCDDLCIQKIYDDLERQQARRKTVLVSDSIEVLISSAAGGAGITLLPNQVELEGRGLVRVLPRFAFGPLDVFALCPPDWHTSWAVRSVVDFVAQRTSEVFPATASTDASGCGPA